MSAQGVCLRQVIGRVQAATVAVGGQQTDGLQASEPGATMTWKRAAPICWHGNVNNVYSDNSATFTLRTRRQGNRTLTIRQR